MRYGLLEDGDTISENDEIFTFSGWGTINATVVGVPYRSKYLPIRRLIDQPKPVELFTIPYGPWIGCTGTIFMNGENKKVLLQNVFVGGERLVIDFPHRKLYDNKHVVLEDDEVISEGDKFVSFFDDLAECQITVGMTVKSATKRYTTIKLVVRSI